MVGEAIALEGTFTEPGDATPQAFRYITPTPARGDLAFVDAHGKPRSISLSIDHLDAQVHLELGYTRMFEGVDLVAGDYEPNAAFAIENLAARAEAVAERE